MGRYLFLVIFVSFSGTARSQEIANATGSKDPTGEAVLFDALPVVEAASLHSQTLMEAPASVTVITDQDIRARGYRTVGEALADVRGFYITSDRAYQTVGVRGLNIPGDTNTRLLILVDGHSMTENIYGSPGFVEQDFGVDLDLIERIEIIRGPSSALYGSNGMFATINIVTKSPAESRPLRASVETDSFGERKVQVSASQYLGRGANLLISASVFNNVGPDLYFPQLESPAMNYGRAVGLDGERGYHAFANVIWHRWSFLAEVGDRVQIVPTGWYGTVFGDAGNWVQDQRGFLEAAYQRELPGDRQFRWRTYYDRYHSANRFDFFVPADDGSDLGAYIADIRQGGNEDWIGSQVTYRFPAGRFGVMTVGGEGSWDLGGGQFMTEISPGRENIQWISHLDQRGGGFFQLESSLARNWKLYFGGRLDGSRLYGASFSPRVGLIYQPSPSTAWKLLYGNAFRNPSQYEAFYGDGASQIANPSLGPEHFQTWEGIYEHQFGARFTVLADAYYYDLSRWIICVPFTGAIVQYQNTSNVPATGIEVEVSGKFARRIKANASLALQSLLDRPFTAGVNSPSRVGKFSLDAPLLGDRFSVSGMLQYLSSRRTLAGNTVGPEYLVNLSFASRGLLPAGFEFQCGIQNLLNWHYSDPADTVQMIDTIPRDGRSFFVRISWTRSREQSEPQRKQSQATKVSDRS
jgi:iron complex outermembrane receptor protein